MRFAPAENLEAGMILGKDIVSANHSFMLKKGVVLTEEYVTYIKDKGYLGAYIVDEDYADVEPEEAISQKTLLAGIKAVESANIGDLLESSREIVSDIEKMERLSIDMLDLRSFDDYTYHHSVNVAVYAVAVGKFMGLSQEEIVQLSQAGMCHDLGKMKIPLEIINKPERLSDEEYAEIKKHPQYSYDILYDNHEVTAVVRQAVIYHHENENGSGYPFGREGHQMPLIAKILHAVDVYDALTTKRPYKDPYTPKEAFEYMIGGKGILFNEDVVDIMRKVIPTYPVGVEVTLSTGELAVVTAQSEDPLRPVVRTKETKKTMCLDSLAYHHVYITACGIVVGDAPGEVEQLNEKRQAVKEMRKDIMMVDDSIISLQHSAAALNKENYHLISLQSGIAAINYMKAKGAPDLILMDIDMPILDGIEAAKKIRHMGYTDVPIIFLTAKGDKETVLKCKAVQAKDYIIKPVVPTYLRERVAVALDEQRER